MANPTSRGDVLEEGGTLGSGSASHFVALVLPLCSRPSPIYGGCRPPFRGPLRFIVITVTSVMNGTSPHTYGVFCATINPCRVRGPSRHRHGELHGEIGLEVSCIPALMTVMTLMTVICRGLLDGGNGYGFHRRWIS